MRIFYWFTNSFLSSNPISFEIIAVVLAVDDIVAPSGVSSTDDQASPFDRLRGGAFRDCPGCSLFRPWLAPPLLDPRASTSDAEIPRSLSSRVAWNNAWRRRRRIKVGDCSGNRFLNFKKIVKTRSLCIMEFCDENLMFCNWRIKFLNDGHRAYIFDASVENGAHSQSR